MTRTLKALALALLTSTAIAQTKINPKTQIAWPAGCVYYNVNTATCPALGVVTFRGTWNSASTYAANDAVFYNGTQYVSLQSSNVNHAPDVSPTYWTVLVAGSNVQVNGVALLSQTPQNFQDSSSVTFQNTSAGNIKATVSTTTLTQGVIAPLSSGQNVVLYPTAFSNLTGDGGTGSVTAGKLAAFISNGPGGGSLSNNTWGTNFSGFVRPSDIPAANITAVYPFMVSSVTNTNSVTYGSCTDGLGHLAGLTPGGDHSSGANWNQQQFTGGSGILGTSIGLVTCTAQTQRSSTTTMTEGYNVAAVGLIVYYTGTPSTYGSTAAQVQSPLYYNAALNQLGVDPNAAFHGADLQGVAISALPTSPLSSSMAVLINNGSTTNDCVVGGGSNYVLCRWNGSAWASFVAGSGISALTSDVTASGTGSVAATVAGLKTVPFCTGFTPTNGQTLLYTTASSPNPCYTSITLSGGGGITQLTGDAAAGPGTGSQAVTFATVNSSPGVCGDATHGCSFTTNGKGLTTAQTAVTVPVQVVSTFVGVPANSQILFYAPSAVALTVPASCTNSKMTATVAATASAAVLFKDLTTSTTLCTFTFAASGTTATTTGSGGSVSAGDVLQLIGPATADATLANLGATVYATR